MLAPGNFGRTGMSILEMGALGEFIGSIAVIVTVVFLGFQMRQNTRMMRAQTQNSLVQSNVETVFKRAEYADSFVREGEGEPLTATDQMRVHLWRNATCRNFENMFYQRQTGLYDDRIFKGRERNVHLIVRGSGFAEWWDESRMLFSDEFVDWIESLMAIEPDWLVAMNAKFDGRRADAAPS
jgi:hypothetical protein